MSEPILINEIDANAETWTAGKRRRCEARGVPAAPWAPVAEPPGKRPPGTAGASDQAATDSWEMEGGSGTAVKAEEMGTNRLAQNAAQH